MITIRGPGNNFIELLSPLVRYRGQEGGGVGFDWTSRRGERERGNDIGRVEGLYMDNHIWVCSASGGKEGRREGGEEGREGGREGGKEGGGREGGEGRGAVNRAE